MVLLWPGSCAVRVFWPLPLLPILPLAGSAAPQPLALGTCRVSWPLFSLLIFRALLTCLVEGCGRCLGQCLPSRAGRILCCVLVAVAAPRSPPVPLVHPLPAPPTFPNFLLLGFPPSLCWRPLACWVAQKQSENMRFFSLVLFP